MLIIKLLTVSVLHFELKHLSTWVLRNLGFIQPSNHIAVNQLIIRNTKTLQYIYVTKFSTYILTIITNFKKTKEYPCLVAKRIKNYFRNYEATYFHRQSCFRPFTANWHKRPNISTGENLWAFVAICYLVRLGPCYYLCVVYHYQWWKKTSTHWTPILKKTTVKYCRFQRKLLI